MKKHSIWLIALLAFTVNGALSAQSKIIDIGLFKKTSDHSKLEVRLRSTQNVENGSYSGGIFTVRFPSSYGVTLSEVPGSSPYGYSFAGPVGQFEGYDYYRYQFAGSVHFVNWEKGKEYPLLTLQVNGTPPPRAAFELVTNNEWTRKNNADFYQEAKGAELERTFYYLPLRAIRFEAKATSDRTVLLDWELEAEETLSHSEIEYSVDGRDFNMIGVEPSHKEKNLVTPGYSHLHLKPANVNFYRIRLVDINGQVTYSPVRAINFDNADADFAVFPNPTAGPLTIISRNLDKYPEGVNFQVIDNSGKVLLYDRVAADNLNIDLSKMPAGAYFVKVLSGQEQVAKFKVVLVMTP
jgi:hypothetical protein